MFANVYAVQRTFKEMKGKKRALSCDADFSHTSASSAQQMCQVEFGKIERNRFSVVIMCVCVEFQLMFDHRFVYINSVNNWAIYTFESERFHFFLSRQKKR